MRSLQVIFQWSLGLGLVRVALADLRQVYQPPPADILGNFKLPVFATWPWHLREAKFDTSYVNCVVIHQSIIGIICI